MNTADREFFVAIAKELADKYGYSLSWHGGGGYTFAITREAEAEEAGFPTHVTTTVKFWSLKELEDWFLANDVQLECWRKHGAVGTDADELK